MIYKLELRQYNNDGIAERNVFALNLPRFSLTYSVREKCGKFKIYKFLLATESFPYCLYSSFTIFFKTTDHFCSAIFGLATSMKRLLNELPAHF